MAMTGFNRALSASSACFSVLQAVLNACPAEQAGVGLLLGEQEESKAVTVKQVVPRGSADRAGKVKVGDQVTRRHPFMVCVRLTRSARSSESEEATSRVGARTGL